MNKLVKSLLITLLAVSAQNLSAHTNKTVMLLRAQNVNLPMETTIFHERTHARVEDRFGGNFQVTPFYGQSYSSKEMGKYFAMKDSNVVSFKQGTAASADYICSDLVVHSKSGAAAEIGSIKIDPRHTEYGVRLDYYQNLDKVLKGLFFKVNTTVAHVENDMKLNVTGTAKDTVVTYFKGGDVLADSNAIQKNLDHAMINGKQDKTGVADVDLAIGYKLLCKESYAVSLNIAATFPTGNEAEGKYVFEPLYGNGKHWGIGGGFDAFARIWGSESHNIKLNLAADYRYLFEATEKRTLGLKTYAMGQYLLLGTKASKVLTPAANILTQNVDVTPESQLDAIASLTYNRGGFTFDLGYNLYFRADESVKIKDAFPADTYIASAAYTGVTAFDAATTAADKLAGTAVLSKESVDVTAAQTPSQFTNGVFGALGYTFVKWDYPLMLGLGGKYDMAAKNSVPDMWQGWIKASLSF